MFVGVQTLARSKQSAHLVCKPVDSLNAIGVSLKYCPRPRTIDNVVDRDLLLQWVGIDAAARILRYRGQRIKNRCQRALRIDPLARTEN